MGPPELDPVGAQHSLECLFHRLLGMKPHHGVADAGTRRKQLTGSQILAALENGVSQVEDGAGRFPQLSGAAMVYDPSAPAGSRVVSVTLGGAVLDPDKIYRVAANDFMLGGGDGYGALGGGKVLIDAGNGTLMANDVMAFVAKTGTVTAAVDGRITTVGP